MRNSEKILKSLSSLIENGILTSKDIRKISLTLSLQDKIINKLDLVSREEFSKKDSSKAKNTIINKLIKGKKTKNKNLNL